MSDLKPIEQNNQRVLLTNQLAEKYGTTNEKIKQNFNNNKSRYTEGKDYILLKADRLKEFKREVENFDLVPANVNQLYLWTEHGALLHAKSLGTDEAWEVYAELVNTYFRAREIAAEKLQAPSSAMETLRLHYAALEELDERTTVIEEKIETVIDRVDNQMTIDHGQQRTLQSAVGNRVYERAAVIYQPGEMKQNARYLFSALYRDLKNRFGVPSYRDIKPKDYLSAMKYVEAWVEPAELRSEAAR